MIEVIRKNLLYNFDGICFNKEDWDIVLNNSSEISILYLKSSAEYNSEYFQGEDLSFVIHDNNQAVGVMPILVHKKEGSWIISCDGENLIRPLFIDDIAKKVKKRLEKKIISIITLISKRLEIRVITLFDFSMELSSWYLLWLDKANNIFVTHQLIIDLRHTINDIRLGFRKSFKPLVNKNFKDWDMEVYEGINEDIFEEFRLFHKEVAGGVTRSKKSWDIQKNQLINQNAFLVTIKDKSNLIGAGFFTYTKDMGSYSVGVYKRELFDKPIGHRVQMKAIEVLKEKGCKLYHIGQKVTHFDNDTPSEKELSISNFKEGFASYVCIQPHLEILLSE